MGRRGQLAGLIMPLCCSCSISCGSECCRCRSVEWGSHRPGIGGKRSAAPSLQCNYRWRLRRRTQLPQNTTPVTSCSSTRLSINSHEPPASRRPSRSCKQLQRQRRRAAFVAPAGDGGGICIRQVTIQQRWPNRSHDQPPGVLCCSACSARVIDERCLRQIRSGLCSGATRQARCACRLCS